MEQNKIEIKNTFILTAFILCLLGYQNAKAQPRETDKDYQTNKVTTLQGRALLLVQSLRKIGNSENNAQSSNLTSNTIKIEAK